MRTTSLVTSGGVLSSVFLLLAACGGGSGSTEGGGGSDTCAQYVNAVVAYYDRCADGTASSFTSARARLEGACARALTAPGTTNMAAQVSACAQKVSAAACNTADDLDCEFTGGTLEDGAPCGESYQCKSGACQTAPESNCGKCIARVAVGGACTGSTSNECVEGAECTNNGKCTTVTIAKAGEKCSGGADEILRCDKGLECSFGSGEATCKAPGAAGAECSSRLDCQTDLRCVAGKCAPGLAEGAACTLDECGKGLGCSAENKCARHVVVKAGEACDLTRQCERGRCAGLSFASGSEPGSTKIVPGKCVDPIPDGAACTADSEDEDAPRCDLFAECVGGKCTPVDPAQCK